MKPLITSLFILTSLLTFGQPTVTYHLSFENASQHEARIKVQFNQLDNDPLLITMSRSSPGRYALHEFVKNVYDLHAFNAEGEELKLIRKDPYSWELKGHNGTVALHYTLFANRADGTYSDVSESHAHLNIPATLIYAPALADREQVLNFNLREDLKWKVATQLVKEDEDTYTAPNLYYLMDSPVEISDHEVRSFKIDGPQGEQTIEFALHHRGGSMIFDEFFEGVKKIVTEEIAVYGKAPEFDYDRYTFLGCYLPWASGDGMEHRNSTIVTSSRELTSPEGMRNLSTVAHEFFHAWNVERLRPKSLEPFDFQKANMSGALWFAEGFTSYYTNLILKRTGIIDEAAYLESITPTFNYVWNSPGRQFFNPVEMSQQAPFVDAATSVDPVNRGNTFISYYSYGHMLGLSLDLSLRNNGKTLDGYMSLLWEKYGKEEKPYTLENLQTTLAEYGGKALAEEFFENYVYDSKMPDYNDLFSLVGIQAQRNKDRAFTGMTVNNSVVSNYPVIGGPAAQAGISKGDKILSVNNNPVDNLHTDDFTKDMKPGQEIILEIERYGQKITKSITLGSDPKYTLELMPIESEKTGTARTSWLGAQSEK
ncbi:M61 family peptidase [Robertkochia marina]|uniref:M61 family peptidase n=1 Tax=Robertkochia marina TaxID=1227945 RepID=A0A4V6RRU4_9FLAO|nr:PDZ domain-containing protein [Robertkochia marina]THD69538.1 M61 family peptidase [Robertkochia marina]TRZ47203.1 M61 family peptidase [Robertkochia marina]